MNAVGLDAELNGHAPKLDAPSWLKDRVDLGEVIQNGVAPPEELVKGLLLRGRVNHIYGPPGSGKTWLACWIIDDLTRRGERVVLFDAENGRRIIGERLAAFSPDPDLVSDRLDYFPSPNLLLTRQAAKGYEWFLDEAKPSLVIFDSWLSFLASAGLEENNSAAIAQWSVTYAKPARDRGVSVLLLDHVPHAGSHARGSTRKKDEVDVQWELRRTKLFDRTQVGEIVLRCEKDREGWLPPSICFSVGGSAESFVFVRSEGVSKEPEDSGMTSNARKALDALKTGFAESGASHKQWREASGIEARSSFDAARKNLVSLGYVRKAEDSKRYFPTVRDSGLTGPLDLEMDQTGPDEKGSSPVHHPLGVDQTGPPIRTTHAPTADDAFDEPARRLRADDESLREMVALVRTLGPCRPFEEVLDGICVALLLHKKSAVPYVRQAIEIAQGEVT